MIKQTHFTEKTLVPISLIAAIATIIYLASAVSHIAITNKSEISAMKTNADFRDDRTHKDIRIIIDKAHSIDVRLARIEALLLDLSEKPTK